MIQTIMEVFSLIYMELLRHVGQFQNLPMCRVNMAHMVKSDQLRASKIK